MAYCMDAAGAYIWEQMASGKMPIGLMDSAANAGEDTKQKDPKWTTNSELVAQMKRKNKRRRGRALV